MEGEDENEDEGEDEDEDEGLGDEEGPPPSSELEHLSGYID